MCKESKEEMDKLIKYSKEVISFKKKELIKELYYLIDYDYKFTYKNVIDKVNEILV